MRASKKKQVTEEEIERALKDFLKSGGELKKLPPEIVPPRNEVKIPAQKYSVYESLSAYNSDIMVQL